MRCQWAGKPYVLLENLRQFDVVLWTDGGTVSSFMQIASSRDGVLHQYVIPQDDREPGRLMLISKMVAGAGSDGPSPVFVSSVLGINAATGLPVGILQNFYNRAAEAQGGGSYLPNMTGAIGFGAAVGFT